MNIKLNFFNGKGCQAQEEDGWSHSPWKSLKTSVDVALGDMDWWGLGSAVTKVKLHDFGGLFHPK